MKPSLRIADIAAPEFVELNKRAKKNFYEQWEFDVEAVNIWVMAIKQYLDQEYERGK